MAPRSAKAKKTADVKVAETAEAPKKGRGKVKNIEEQENDFVELEPEIIEKVAPTTEKKAKRGKKGANDANGQEQDGKDEETAPPIKKGRKKNSEENNDEKPVNADNSSEEESSPADDDKQNGNALVSNGDSEESQVTTKGRKKPQKKEIDAKPKESGRGKKNAKPTESIENATEKDEPMEEKPKPAAKGRGRKAPPKVENDPEDEEKPESLDEEAKPEPVATKGRKKGLIKSTKEKSPESDKEEAQDKTEEADDVPEEPIKKESKARKNLGKKTQAKEESQEKEEEAKDEPASKKRKTVKKDIKAKGDTKDEDVAEEIPEEKPTKGKRGQKKAVEVPIETEDEPQDTGEQPSKRKRKQAEEKAPAEDKKKTLKNKALTNYEDLDFANTSTNQQGKEWNYKIASWNVDGIRAWLGKGGLDYLKYEKPDILCLQEVKCAQDKLPDDLVNVPGYHAYWLCSEQDGYAGVGIYTAKLAMNVQYGLQNEELDSEGRIITAEYEHFYLISTYVPNAGRKLVTLPKKLQWNEEFRKHVKELDKKKPVIICGDMNVAHNEIDLANPKNNKKNAGFTEEERSGMTELLGDGYVDTYRHLYPDKKGAYTFWTYMMNSRAKNMGWRLDYFIVSERLLASVCDSVIRDGVYGSDHCPITLFLHLSSAEKPK